jgi:hypothetical protein
MQHSDGHQMGAHALARDAAGGVRGAEEDHMVGVSYGT